jgi:hypothetical protein
MVMAKRAVAELASDHFRVWQRATNKAKILDLWARGDSEHDRYDKPALPATANEEYTELRDIAPSPWGRLVIGAVAQTLGVTSHRSTADPAEESTETFTEAWRLNGLASRQGGVYRAALGQNMAFVTTLPGTRPRTGTPTVRVRGVPATEMIAFYDVEGEDDFARFSMRGRVQNVEGEKRIAMEVMDEEAVYWLSCDIDGSEMRYISHEPHPVGKTPVHRFAPHLDLEGRATGEIQPIVPLLRRMDQDVFDRVVVQRFNSWRVRYISGMVRPANEAEERAAKMMLRVTDLLVSESAETKFGTLDPTDIAPYVAAHDADLKDLSAISQTPPHHLLGQMANLSAEALAAAETSLMRKVDEYKLGFGQTWDQVLRSCAFILADTTTDRAEAERYLTEALDYTTEVRWKDSSARSLSQAADALGKIATQLGVPVEMLWEQLPFWKKEDTDKAKSILSAEGADAMLMQFLEASAPAAQQAA